MENRYNKLGRKVKDKLDEVGRLTSDAIYDLTYERIKFDRWKNDLVWIHLRVTINEYGYMHIYNVPGEYFNVSDVVILLTERFLQIRMNQYFRDLFNHGRTL